MSTFVLHTSSTACQVWINDDNQCCIYDLIAFAIMGWTTKQACNGTQASLPDITDGQCRCTLRREREVNLIQLNHRPVSAALMSASENTESLSGLSSRRARRQTQRAPYTALYCTRHQPPSATANTGQQTSESLSWSTSTGVRVIDGSAFLEPRNKVWSRADSFKPEMKSEVTFLVVCIVKNSKHNCETKH